MVIDKLPTPSRQEAAQISRAPNTTDRVRHDAIKIDERKVTSHPDSLKLPEAADTGGRSDV